MIRSFPGGAYIRCRLGNLHFCAGWFPSNPFTLGSLTLYEFDTHEEDVAYLFDFRIAKFEVFLAEESEGV